MASVRRHGTVALTALFGLQVAACSEPIVETNYPTVAVGFAPPDGTTAYGDGELAVTVYDYGDYADPALMADLAVRTRLTTWPERAPVVADSLIEQPVSNGKRVLLTPTSALDDRWYLIEVATMGLSRTFNVPAQEWSDGFVGTRFRPGSHPQLTDAKFCKKEAAVAVHKDATVMVYLVLSEPATVDPTSVRLVQDGQAVACTTTIGGPAFQVGVDCPTLDLAKPVELSIGTGGVAATGVAFPAGSWAIDIPTLPVGDCPTFVAPIE